MATTVKTSSDVASLFLVQMLEREKVRVERWVADLEDMTSYASFLDETCNAGIIRCIISSKQGAWLYKMIRAERKGTEHVAYFNGEQVGTWAYREAVTGDSNERMTFRLDPAFVQEYMAVAPELLERVAA